MTSIIKIIIGSLCVIVTTNVFAVPNEVISTKNSVFYIISTIENGEGKKLSEATGTGFLINNDGIILTNHHVIETKSTYVGIIHEAMQAAAKEIGCKLPSHNAKCKNQLNTIEAKITKYVQSFKPKLRIVDGKRKIESNLKDAEVLWKRKSQDLAILQVNNLKNKTPLILSTVIPKQLDAVYAVGFPGVTNRSRLDQDNVEASMTDGSISLILENGVRNISSRVIQHNADVNPGNSGGPLVDSCGSVIGINTQAITGGNGERITQGVYFSSHIDSAITALQDQGIEFNSTSDSCISGAEEASNLSLYGIIASIIGVLVALIAIIFSLKKPRQQIINTIETYTQYIKRGGKRHPSDKVSTSHTSDKTWKLSGTIKDTGERINIEITEKELKNGKDITIGRNRKLCDYAIPDVKRLSRRHARFICKNGELMVEDLNSSNKTYIDNNELTPGKASPLSSGSVLSLGKSVYLTLS